jgi:Ser/Thr protein kinase RdoA (MazF antagonist)
VAPSCLPGQPTDEVRACVSLLDAAASRVVGPEQALFERVRQAASQAEDCRHLPHAFTHPDFNPANAITSTAGRTTLVDWTGAGRGPRLWSLAFLLWAAGAAGLRSVDAVICAYAQHVRLEKNEFDHLAGAIAARPVIFTCWGFATGRQQLSDAADRLATIGAHADQIASRARAAVV